MKKRVASSARFPRRGNARITKESSAKTMANSDLPWFFTIFAAALVLRIVYLLQIESIPLFANLAGDGRTYDEWAQRIAAGDWLGKDVFYQAPLYPYFLGVLQLLFGHSFWPIRIVQ